MVLMRGDTRPVKREGRKMGIPKVPKVYRMLDLFCGTGSVGDVFRGLGYDVISVDFDPRRGPSLVVDIGVWQYWRVFQPHYFDVVSCCPPCTEFSRAMTSRPRDLAKADRLVQAALEIVNYLQPDFWFLENPRTGELPESNT